MGITYTDDDLIPGQPGPDTADRTPYPANVTPLGGGAVPQEMGAFEQPATPRPRMQKRYERIPLHGAYEGFSIKAWINFPQKLLTQAQTGDPDVQAAALGQIVVEHNFVDFDGEPFPPPDDPACWTECPLDLLACVFTAIAERFGKLPPRSGGR